MENSFKAATSVSFGRTRLYLCGNSTELMANGHQENSNSTTDIVIDANICIAAQSLSIKLHKSLDVVASRKILQPTVHLGFYDGLVALAEGLIVDEKVDFYRVVTSLTVDLFGVPKFYRGKIHLRGSDFNLFIYETYFVPHTKLSYMLKK